MQRLFDFVPTKGKPDTAFFRSEQCEIIRAHSGRGYFAITDEVLPKMSAYMPRNYCRMYWTIKDPATIKALAGRIRAVKPVGKWPTATNP